MNITKGEIKQDTNSGRLYSTTTNDTVVMDGVALYSSDEAKANTKLLFEALTIANQTGLSPKQLLEQRDELLAFVQSYMDAINEQTIHIQDTDKGYQKSASFRLYETAKRLL